MISDYLFVVFYQKMWSPFVDVEYFTHDQFIDFLNHDLDQQTFIEIRLEKKEDES